MLLSSLISLFIQMLQLLYSDNVIFVIHKKDLNYLNSLAESKVIFTISTNEQVTNTVVIGSDFFLF